MSRKAIVTVTLLTISGLWGMLSPSPAPATLYVMMTDEELVAQAEVIVRVRVMSVEAAPGLGRPAIDYQVRVEDSILGSAVEDTLLVRVPGGVRSDGLGLRVWAAPRFQPGHRALLFLERHPDGTYRILHLMLGAFREATSEGRRFAIRDLGPATQIDAVTDSQALLRRRSHLPRDLQGFRDWLRDRVAGREREVDYLVDEEVEGLSSLEAPFTLLRSPADPAPFGCGINGGNGIRFTQFDTGGSVPWSAHQVGQTGINGGGFTEFQAGLAAWNNDPGTLLNLTYAGITNALSGFLATDGLNVILFEDPNNEIAGSFTGSGTLAIGGAFFSCDDIHTFGNDIFHRALEAEIITQDGSSIFFSSSSSPSQAAAEVFGHELGHTLGLGHSCGDATSPACNNAVLDDALMRAFVHDDGRGARLGSDDRDGIAFLYGQRREPRPRRPEAPTSLFVTASAIGQFTLAWHDRSSNETAFIIEERTAMGEFSERDRVPANTTFYNATDIPPAAYRVYRVRATNSGGTSAATDEASATSFGLREPCVADATTLCMVDERFRVTIDWEDSQGNSGQGVGVVLTSNTGLFYFFSPNNIELLIKILHACRTDDAWWVFAGGLTDVHTVLTVEDTSTGVARAYINPQSTPFAPIQDTETFHVCP